MIFYEQIFNILRKIYVGEPVGLEVWAGNESSPVVAIVKVWSRVYWHKYGDVRFDKLRRLGTRDANDNSLRSDNESAVNGTLLLFTRRQRLGGTLS